MSQIFYSFCPGKIQISSKRSFHPRTLIFSPWVLLVDNLTTANAKKPLCCIYAQKSTTKLFLLVHSFSSFSFMWLRANCKDGRGLVWQGMKDKDHTIRGAPGLSLISSYFSHFPLMNFLAEKGRWNFPNSPAEGCCGVWVWTVFKNLGQLSFLYFG